MNPSPPVAPCPLPANLEKALERALLLLEVLAYSTDRFVPPAEREQAKLALNAWKNRGDAATWSEALARARAAKSMGGLE